MKHQLLQEVQRSFFQPQHQHKKRQWAGALTTQQQQQQTM
jgi:hypothetical protein